jgi:formate dehydrogenase subunit delta
VAGDGVNKLVRMANQIADNFDFGSDQDKAIAGVVDHLTRFWTPDMKEAIIEQQRNGTIGLNEIAAAAVKSLGERFGQPA